MPYDTGTQPPNVTQPTVVLSTPVIYWGNFAPERKEDRCLIQQALMRDITTSIGQRLRRVRVYGTSNPDAPSARAHVDQRFLATTSTHEQGVYENPCILIVCRSEQQGWYIVTSPLTVR